MCRYGNMTEVFPRIDGEEVGILNHLEANTVA